MTADRAIAIVSESAERLWRRKFARICILVEIGPHFCRFDKFIVSSRENRSTMPMPEKSKIRNSRYSPENYKRKFCLTLRRNCDSKINCILAYDRRDRVWRDHRFPGPAAVPSDASHA